MTSTVSRGRSEPSEPDAFWFSVERRPVPPLLAELRDIGVEFERPLFVPAVCLASVEGDSLASVVRNCRAVLGDNAYLVMVYPGSELPQQAVRAIDFGADDVVAADDRLGLALAFARAERVTQDRRQAAALRRARDVERDYLQACIDNLPTPIFFKNEHGHYVGCNRAFQDYLGLPHSAIIGHSVYDVAPCEHARIYDEADKELMRRGGTQVYEALVRYADGSQRDVVFQKAVMTDSSGAPRGVAGAMLDITERKRLEARLADAAARDPLTNLYNRRKFFALASGIAGECRDCARPATLAVIDIDHFKSVNDGYGHAAGDRALCDVADLLQNRIGEANVVARAGGEEFFAILPGYSASAASAWMDRLRKEVAELVVEDGGITFGVTVSIGVAELDAAGETLWDCLRRADGALYSAKYAGRNCIALAA